MSRQVTADDPALAIWTSFIETCRSIPGTDEIRLAKLNNIYPSSNGINIPSIEKAWSENGLNFINEFDKEAANSEKQYEVLLRAQELLGQLIQMKRNGNVYEGSGGVGMGISNRMLDLDGTGSASASGRGKGKRKVSPSIHSQTLTPIGVTGGTSSRHLSPFTTSGSPYPTSARSISPLPPHGHPHAHSHLSSSNIAPAPVHDVNSIRRKQSQLPLRTGRKVIYKPTMKEAVALWQAKKDEGAKEIGFSPDDQVNGGTAPEWTLCNVVGQAGNDRTKYVIRDDDDPDVKFTAKIDKIYLPPDLGAPPDHPSHPNSYEDYPRRTSVLALYPNLTVFYRAEVLASPVPGTGNGRGVADPGSKAKAGKYLLKFEDDSGQTQWVDYHMVLEFPTGKENAIGS